MAFKNQHSKKIFWLAVHPTPYNYYLYNQFKNLWKNPPQIYFSNKENKELPFKEKNYDVEDKFFNEKLGFDFRIIRNVLKKDVFTVFVGWNNRTKMLGIILSIIFGKPYGIWTDSINPSNYRSRNFWVALKKLFLRKASLLMTTGEFGIQKVREAGIRNKNILSLPFFVPVPDNAAIKEYTKNEKLKILIISRLIPRKGILIGIKAVEKVIKAGYDNVELTICGIGPEKNMLHDYIKTWNLGCNVILQGWKNSKELTDLMINSHVLLHPILEHDPYPLVILESISYGLPIIGNNLAGSLVENVKNNYNGFVLQAGLIDEIANAIFTILKTPELIKKMSENSLAISKTWNIEQKASEIEKRIADIL